MGCLNGSRKHPRWPMIVLRTPKGWTAWQCLFWVNRVGSSVFSIGPVYTRSSTDARVSSVRQFR